MPEYYRVDRRIIRCLINLKSKLLIPFLKILLHKAYNINICLSSKNEY